MICTSCRKLGEFTSLIQFCPRNLQPASFSCTGRSSARSLPPWGSSLGHNISCEDFCPAPFIPVAQLMDGHLFQERHVLPRGVFHPWRCSIMCRQRSSLLLQRKPLRGRSVLADTECPGRRGHRAATDRGHFNLLGRLSHPGRTMALLPSRPVYFRLLCPGPCDMYHE